jgi:hypothetical protein
MPMPTFLYRRSIVTCIVTYVTFVFIRNYIPLNSKYPLYPPPPILVPLRRRNQISILDHYLLAGELCTRLRETLDGIQSGSPSWRKASADGGVHADQTYDTDSIYIQCSEICTLRYEKLHTET